MLKYKTTISIDPLSSSFHFYSMSGNDKASVIHSVKQYPAGPFDDKFFKFFKDALKEFSNTLPSDSIRKVTVLLPDSAVFTDILALPNLNTNRYLKKNLEVTLNGLFRNASELSILSDIVEQNKQNSTFIISALQNHIISSIYAACSENKMLVDTLSTASGAAVCGATNLNPKLKNASYLFLDIKEGYSKLTFVAKGTPTGSYTLPFGSDILRAPDVVPEELMFDHSYSALVVLNSRERAKDREFITTMSADSQSRAEKRKERADSVARSLMSNDNQADFGYFINKIPRDIPESLKKEIPDSEQGIQCENFRTFVKWTLSLIAENQKLTSIAKPDFVCVNMPSDLAYLLDSANKESEENGITFTRLTDKEDALTVSSDIELFGGLFPQSINPITRF